MADIQRMCANCSSQQTPLWRRSPLGPKTLCNACGVRMKKGRLVFVPHTRSFITVESPAAVAKRQRKEREARELNHHLAAVHRPRHPLAAHPPAPSTASRLAAAQAAPQPAAQSYPHLGPQGHLPSRPAGVAKSAAKRQRKAFKVPQGLYYLLAAIDVVETA